jgi:transposase
MRFADYLKAAWVRTRDDAQTGKDRGDLELINKLCRGSEGVVAKHSALTPTSFLAAYHRCVAAIGKNVSKLEDKFFGTSRRNSFYSGPRKLPPAKLLWWPRKGVAMAGKRKQHTAAFKAQVALIALKGDRTVNELASQYGVHPTLIHAWKKQLLAGADQVFSNGSRAATADAEAEKAELFEQIGRLKRELEWLKKKVGPIA